MWKWFSQHSNNTRSFKWVENSLHMISIIYTISWNAQRMIKTDVSNQWKSIKKWQNQNHFVFDKRFVWVEWIEFYMNPLWYINWLIFISNHRPPPSLFTDNRLFSVRVGWLSLNLPPKHPLHGCHGSYLLHIPFVMGLWGGLKTIFKIIEIWLLYDHIGV